MTKTQTNKLVRLIKSVDVANTTVYAYIKTLMAAGKTKKIQLDILKEVSKVITAGLEKGDYSRRTAQNVRNSVSLLKWAVTNGVVWKDTPKSVLEGKRIKAGQRKRGKGSTGKSGKAPKGKSSKVEEVLTPKVVNDKGMVLELSRNIKELQAITTKLTKSLKGKLQNLNGTAGHMVELRKVVKRFKTAAANCGWDKVNK
jgi:hypothetical protein